MTQWSIKSLLEEHGYDYKFLGSEGKTIDSISPLYNATSSDLSFCSSDDCEALTSILRSKAE